MVVLVTGGNGFIGKAFIKRYKKVMDIVAPSHEQLDLCDARSVDKFFQNKKIDAVLHLAGLSESGKVAESNAKSVVMFNNIQNMSIRYGVKKLIVVCDGGQASAADCSEETTDGDGTVSLNSDLIVRLAEKDKISTVLRVYGVYGNGGGQNRPINKIVAAGSRGKAKIIIDRDMVVSGIDIDDAVGAIGRFLLKDYPQGDYSLVAADKMSYYEIAKLVKRLVRKDGGDIEIVVKHKEQGAEYSASNDKLVETTGIKIASMQSGIKKLYQELK